MPVIQCDVTVLGGLPITVKAWIAEPDRSVGINETCVDDFEITHVNGRKVKNANWILTRMKAKDIDMLETDILEAY